MHQSSPCTWLYQSKQAASSPAILYNSYINGNYKHNFNHTDPAPLVSVGVSGSLFTGNRVTFTCSVEVSVSILSTTRPVAVWRRGTTQLSNNSQINVSEPVSTGRASLFESNLTINSIEAADSGNYTCETTLVLIATSNIVSTNSSLVSIVVEGEPEMFPVLLFYVFVVC